MTTTAPTLLSPAQRSQIRRLSQPKESAPGEEAGELNVVPYLDIITNIMMFVLASISVTFASTIETRAAALNPLHHEEPGLRALHLTALITRSGIGLGTASGGIAPGCEGVGAGLTLPAKQGEIDVGGLQACARRIKDAHPDFAAEEQVTVTASPDVPYQTLVAVMDALRSDERGQLFPAVHLGVAR
jgi:biopolymer transport protein ExbD